jgi:DNA-binding response OmpR family regulator
VPQSNVEAVIKVLVIDDEVDLAAVMVEWLSKRGHEAFQISRGSEIKDWVQSHQVDVILLDLMMPDANGLSLISQLRAWKPHTKVIIISAIDDPKIAAAAVREGASFYLAKPIDFAELERILAELE